MISYPLLRQSIRGNYKLLLAFALILTVYAVMIIGMYDPDITAKMEALLASFPEEMLSAFGFRMEDSTLTGFLASYLFGFLMLVFPMIYEIVAANRLIAAKVEKGSMAYLIGTPNSRVKIAYTQAVYLAGSTAVLIAWVAVLGTAVCEWKFPGMLRIGTFHDLCIGVFALHMLIGGIAFFASCISSELKQSLLAGAGIPLVCYLIHMLANMGGNLEVLSFATFFSLFDTGLILEVEPLGYVFMGILAAAGILFYAAGILLFRKRDLSI